MKSRYTVIVRDNKNGDTLLSFNANDINYSLKTNPTVIRSADDASATEVIDTGGRLTIDALVVLENNQEPKEYFLDEDIEEDCLTTHSYVDIMGMEVCGICGLKKNVL